MPCYHPVKGYKARTLNPSGKRSIVFNVSDGYEDMAVDLPCGRCIGCRLERSRQWAVRCMHEADQYEQNAFITLTYDEENLPEGGTLRLRDFQLFMKRLRKKADKPVRFFHCGEYGETYCRPHYHACLFGIDFADKAKWKTEGDNTLYVSQTLEKLWPVGFATIGNVDFQSAAYVARYVTKKVTGPRAVEHYRVTDPDTGEVFDRKPEYATMSRRPGIGAGWLRKYKSDVYPNSGVIVNGHETKPTKYYDKLFEHEEPTVMKTVRSKRIIRGKLQAKDTTPQRLRIREKIHLSRAELLLRNSVG